MNVVTLMFSKESCKSFLQLYWSTEILLFSTFPSNVKSPEETVRFTWLFYLPGTLSVSTELLDFKAPPQVKRLESIADRCRSAKALLQDGKCYNFLLSHLHSSGLFLQLSKLKNADLYPITNPWKMCAVCRSAGNTNIKVILLINKWCSFHLLQRLIEVTHFYNILDYNNNVNISNIHMSIYCILIINCINVLLFTFLFGILLSLFFLIRFVADIFALNVTLRPFFCEVSLRYLLV